MYDSIIYHLCSFSLERLHAWEEGTRKRQPLLKEGVGLAEKVEPLWRGGARQSQGQQEPSMERGGDNAMGVANRRGQS